MDAVDGNGHSALFRACERGHTEVVVVLLDAGASVTLTDDSGRCALHWAASGGHSAICSSLLHQGISADSADSGGWVAEAEHQVIDPVFPVDALLCTVLHTVGSQTV